MTTAVKIFSNDGKVQIAASAGQTSLAFDFPIFNENHITVQLTRSNVVTTLVLNTDYTVPLASVGQESGGTVTLVSPALSGDVYTLFLDVPYERTTDFNQAGDFFADTLNLELDLLTQQNQQINRDISSTLRFQTADPSIGSEIPLASIRAGKYLAFDGSGNVIAADGTGGTAISAPMVPFVQAASLVAAKALLITSESIATADIANNAVTNAKLATAPAYTVKANNTNATANESDVAIASLYPQNFQIGASVSGNALTITLQPTPITFRSGTGGSGTLTYNQVTAPITLVVPSGATLGTSNGVQSRLAVAALDAGNGITELFVSNITNEFSTSLENITSTIAISASSNLASTAYSTTARTNVPYKVLGVIVSTQATAGTWATAPSFIQGYGVSASSGDALASSLSTVFNVSGSAPLYACRAWVNFNGTGTVAIRAGGNVSSITDNGTGDYTVNFITAMPDANYAFIPSAGGGSGGSTWINSSFWITAPLSTSNRVRLTDGTAATDAAYVTFSVFR